MFTASKKLPFPESVTLVAGAFDESLLIIIALPVPRRCRFIPVGFTYHGLE